jgi:hypothetical protein
LLLNLAVEPSVTLAETSNATRLAYTSLLSTAHLEAMVADKDDPQLSEIT